MSETISVGIKDKALSYIPEPMQTLVRQSIERKDKRIAELCNLLRDVLETPPSISLDIAIAKAKQALAGKEQG